MNAHPPRTPMHSFRCPDELWDTAKAKAEDRGETITEVLRRALERYIKREGQARAASTS